MKKNSDKTTDIERIAAEHEVTPAGVALLRIISEPEARTMQVTQICEKAGISRDTYYRLFKDQRFSQAYTELCKTMLLSAAAPASQALAAQAAMGDVAAIKMILELAAIYQPQATLNVQGRVEQAITLKDIISKRKQD